MTQTHDGMTGVCVTGSSFARSGRFTTWGRPDRSSQMVVFEVPRSMAQWVGMVGEASENRVRASNALLP